MISSRFFFPDTMPPGMLYCRYMKKAFVFLAIIALAGIPAHAAGMAEPELVNSLELPLEGIGKVTVNYRSDGVRLLRGEAGVLVVREYMTESNERFFAGVRRDSGELSVQAGQRPVFRPMMTFRSRVEIVLPEDFGNVTVKTSSGNIAVVGGRSFVTLELASSSGNIATDSLSGGTLRVGATSGNLSLGPVEADSAELSSTSGSVAVGAFAGRSLDARTTSGGLSLGSVGADVAKLSSTSGSVSTDAFAGRNLYARTTSGRLSFGSVGADVAELSSTSGSLDIAVGPDFGNVSLETGSGAVRLGLPPGLSFGFSSRTGSGSLHTPFDDRLFSSLTDRNRIQGTVGTADGDGTERSMEIRTGSGSVRVRYL